MWYSVQLLEDKKTNAYFYTLEKAANNSYYPEKSTRELALEWWKDLSIERKNYFIGYQLFQFIDILSLTGKEIEEIWKKNATRKVLSC